MYSYLFIFTFCIYFAGYLSTIPGSEVFDEKGNKKEKRPITSAESIAVASDGSLYVLDEQDAAIKKITPEGMKRERERERKQRRKGRKKRKKEKRPITSAESIAVASDGSLYVLDEQDAIKKITPEGMKKGGNK